MLSMPKQPQTKNALDDLVTWRCRQCGRIVARMNLVAGSIVEIKCRCGQMNYFGALPVATCTPIVDKRDPDV